MADVSDTPTPNRYQLPLISMVGAMIVVIAFVSVGRIWRSATHADQALPVQTVPYQGWLKAARSDGRLHAFAPARLPRGWRSTSASYSAGTVPHWHLGLLTADRQYVGLDESLQSMSDLLSEYAGSGVTPGATVTVGGVAWRTWTDSRGDYLLGRQLKAPKGRFPENVLVGGSASPAQVRSYAASLR